jgi:hypothetical protein
MALSQHQEEIAGWFTVQNALKKTSKVIKESGTLSDEDTFEWDKPDIADIRGILSNEFKGTTLLDFILFNYSNRFNEVSPYDFEDFICFLVLAKGHYEAKVTSSSSDYGVDITCETLVNEKYIKTAIQVKRYAENNKVGVKDLNQLLGGKDYYDCEKAIIVTTSDLTKNAWQLANKTNTEVWTWDEINNYIQHYMLLDYPYYDFKKIEHNQAKSLEVSVSKIEQDLETDSQELSVRIKFKLMNNGSSPVEIKGLSIDSCLIKSNGFQINNMSFDSDGFTKGLIYPNGFSELGVFIAQDKAGRITSNDRFILELLGEDQDFSFDLKLSPERIKPSQYAGANSSELSSGKDLVTIGIIVLVVVLLFLAFN